MLCATGSKHSTGGVAAAVSTGSPATQSVTLGYIIGYIMAGPLGTQDLMSTPAHEALRFSHFEIDLQTKELRRGGRPVKLPPQALRLLEFLASHPGQLVTREDIRQEIWSGNTFVDFEHGINKSIRQIRDALRDDADRPKFIETMPRRGYRFIAEIEHSEGAAEIAVLGEAAPPPALTERSSARVSVLEPPRMAKPTAVPGLHRLTGRRMRGAAALVAFAALLTAAFEVGGWRDRLLHQPPLKSIESLAVLPLENLSHDPEQDYFADGMTDELITDLAKISALRVISRTSVMQYKGTKKPVPEIARELNVDAVLEGTVTRDQGRVRITAQLIAAAPEKHLWAEQYEGSLSEVLTLQDAVAKAVAHEIQIKLTPRERTLLATPRAVDPAAYEAYLKGRYLSDQGGEGNLKRSREYFERAIAKDPGYALAWAGLADTYDKLASWGVLSRQDSAPRALAAAEKALKLDNSLVGPLVTLASVKVNYEWDWSGAERSYKRAIELNPNSGTAHARYAIYLADLGRTREAVSEIRRARDVEPLSGIFPINVVWFCYIARQYDQAELEFHKITEWHPKETGGYILASVYLQTGRTREAVAELQKDAAESHRGLLNLMYLGHGLGVSGARAEGQKVLEEMLGLSQRRYVPPDYIAVVYEGLGERDRALQWFEKACAERSMNGWILPDPQLDQIRTEPRFKKLMRRMGLPQ
jgi:TolB-like protein/DNA-binding winged helix-turn-helix (wHTH) protein/Tfp pilus assembly protein PilF